MAPSVSLLPRTELCPGQHCCPPWEAGIFVPVSKDAPGHREPAALSSGPKAGRRLLRVLQGLPEAELPAAELRVALSPFVAEQKMPGVLSVGCC